MEYSLKASLRAAPSLSPSLHPSQHVARTSLHRCEPQPVNYRSASSKDRIFDNLDDVDAKPARYDLSRGRKGAQGGSDGQLNGEQLPEQLGQQTWELEATPYESSMDAAIPADYGFTPASAPAAAAEQQSASDDLSWQPRGSTAAAAVQVPALGNGGYQEAAIWQDPSQNGQNGNHSGAAVEDAATGNWQDPQAAASQVPAEELNHSKGGRRLNAWGDDGTSPSSYEQDPAAGVRYGAPTAGPVGGASSSGQGVGYESEWGEVGPATDWGEEPLPGSGEWGWSASSNEVGSDQQTWEPDPRAPQGPGAGQGDAWRAAGSGTGYTSNNRWSSARDTGAGNRKGQWAGREPGSGFAGYQKHPIDITILTREETDVVLPLAPTGRQASYYSPRTVPEYIVQVMGSVGLTVLLSKAAVLAAPALLYPMWNPWVRAGLRNFDLFAKQFSFLGLWKAVVLEAPPPAAFPFPNMLLGGRYQQPGAVLRLVVGEPYEGGPRAVLEFPSGQGDAFIQVGDPVELLVLGKDPTFKELKVVREVYLPRVNMWLADYPFLNRGQFINISQQIGIERQANGAPYEGETYSSSVSGWDEGTL